MISKSCFPFSPYSIYNPTVFLGNVLGAGWLPLFVFFKKLTSYSFLMGVGEVNAGPQPCGRTCCYQKSDSEHGSLQGTDQEIHKMGPGTGGFFMNLGTSWFVEKP